MKKNLTYKIIEKHLVSGEMKAGKEISIKIDQTLTQDATGTMVYLQFEAIGIKRVQTELSADICFKPCSSSAIQFPSSIPGGFFPASSTVPSWSISATTVRKTS